MSVKKKQQKYPESFRREAVKRSDAPGVTAADVAKELGIHVNQIYNWRNQFNKLRGKQFTVMDSSNYSKNESVEMRKLRKKLADVEEERDFLKKAAAYFAKEDE